MYNLDQVTHKLDFYLFVSKLVQVIHLKKSGKNALNPIISPYNKGHKCIMSCLKPGHRFYVLSQARTQIYVLSQARTQIYVLS